MFHMSYRVPFVRARGEALAVTTSRGHGGTGARGVRGGVCAGRGGRPSGYFGMHIAARRGASRHLPLEIVGSGTASNASILPQGQAAAAPRPQPARRAPPARVIIPTPPSRPCLTLFTIYSSILNITQAHLIALQIPAECLIRTKLGYRSN
ncbi:hypothetical protein EVAR_14836_1 [Eumeta japonica]|uniref:Uncharacterized protein n=1 Tax=Eumeta variegata TaxID=151549 RepID=A0A4C1V4J4_EUMVA|nr:hypothetical protein EVAR_14836_1 [Eumeta japonica]